MKKIDLFGVAYIDPVIWCELDPKIERNKLQQKIPQPPDQPLVGTSQIADGRTTMLLKQSYQRFFASHPKLLSKLSKLPVLNTS